MTSEVLSRCVNTGRRSILMCTATFAPGTKTHVTCCASTAWKSLRIPIPINSTSPDIRWARLQSLTDLLVVCFSILVMSLCSLNILIFSHNSFLAIRNCMPLSRNLQCTTVISAGYSSSSQKRSLIIRWAITRLSVGLGSWRDSCLVLKWVALLFITWSLADPLCLEWHTLGRRCPQKHLRVSCHKSHC